MKDTKYWIALEQCRGIGPAHMIEIRNALKSLELDLSDLYELDRDDLHNEFHFTDKIADSILEMRDVLPKIEEDYFSLMDAGIEVIPFFSESYPQPLHERLGHGIPPILYTFGKKELLKDKAIALLGDRDVSEKGELIAFEAARELARHSIVTISGLAHGVGLIAHRSALVNNGSTIAVVPYGMLHFNPPDLIKGVFDPERILIISTFYPTREANKFNAFIRNKIICALSMAVYIVEAPAEGGIFEAAKSAQKLNIPLFTTQYGQYPKNAGGNRIILEELGGEPVLGKMENNLLIPNMDKLIGIAKFG